MKILAAVDLSESSQKIILETIKLASKIPCEVFLIHVVDPEPEFLGLDYGPKSSRMHLSNKIKKERTQLRELAKKFSTENVILKPVSMQGATAETIISESEKLNCDIIIVGSHGRGAMHQILVGSVSEEVLRESRIPILIIPTKDIT
jgi:nucleotide-binding universal stress UspA family protein